MKRYRINPYTNHLYDHPDYEALEDSDGDYVEYSDVEALQKECEVYKKALKRIASNDGMGSVHPSPADPLRGIASEALQSQRVSK